MTAAIHHWRKGNISTIVTVLGDLAPSDSQPYTIGGRETSSIVTVLFDLAPSDSQPYTIGGRETSSIVTVLGDLAQSDSSHTPLAEGKQIYHCHSAS